MFLFFHLFIYYFTDTQVLELTIARTLIPPQDTSYVCTAFSLPDEMKVRDYHIIGAEAVIDNHAIMHHILVYGCIDERGSFTLWIKNILNVLMRWNYCFKNL